MRKHNKVTVAPNGARRQKSDHPALPLSTSEIADTARDCFDAGADEIHLHVREDDGAHSLDVGRYRDAMAAISEVVPQMPIQITTESAGVFDVKAQYHCLAGVAPSAASISTREMARDVHMAGRVYALADEMGTKVQHILYSVQCIEQLIAWRKAGVVPSDMSDVIFVLGQYSPPILGAPDDLAVFLSTIKGHGFDWAVCAFGQNEHTCLRGAIQQGGDIRIGFENNTQRSDGSVFESNAASITEFLNSVSQQSK